MQLEENSQAILLLSAHFGSPRRGDPTPLTPAEYGKLSAWLHEHRFEPKDFLHRFDAIRSAWEGLGSKVTLDRLDYLVGRAMAMGVALEKWNSAGIWIVTRAAAAYPDRLRRNLGHQRPPVLFGVGNPGLLNKGGLAIVGSRHIDAKDRDYAERIARCAARSGMNVVSGGARGVDETAMRGALEADGTALGILADSLLKAALSGKWRAYLKSNDLCLVSPFYPEAGFNVGNAMGRNKYIYCLSDYGLVVRSDKGSGGTWAGATEAIKKKLAPVFVKAGSDAAGNAALIELGASLLDAPEGDSGAPEWLLAALRSPGAPSVGAQDPGADKSPEASTPKAEAAGLGGLSEQGEPSGCASDSEPVPGNPETRFFDYFISQVQELLSSQGDVTLQQLKDRHPDLAPKQITDWLKRAVEEGVLSRQGKAHRYQLSSVPGAQPTLFGGEGS